MAKFQYRLQNILDIKTNLEAQAKANYGNAKKKLYEEQEKLARMNARKKEMEDCYRRYAQGAVMIKKLLETKRAIDFMREQIKEQYVQVRVAQKNLEVAKARLQELMKERKTFDKLREHAFDDFLLEQNAQEMKEIDELVSYRFNDKEA